MYKILLGAIIVAASICGAATEIHLPLLDFKKTKLLGSATKRKIKVEIKNEKMTFAYQSVKNGGERWPALIMSAKQLPYQNLAPFESVFITVNNPARQAAHFTFWLKSKNGHLATSKYVVPQGKHIFKFNLSQELRNRPLEELQIMIADPVRDGSLCFESIELSTGDLDAALSLLQNRYGEKHCIAELFKMRRNLKPDFDLLLQYQQKYKAVLTSLRTAMAENLLKTFNARFGKNKWGYVIASGMEKVYRDRADLPFRGQVGGAAIFKAGRNDNESLQLVLRSSVPVEHVKVELSDLKSNNGDILSQKNLQPLVVSYVNSGQPRSYDVEHIGWNPDPLTPNAENFTLDSNVWQPVWLDIHVPKGQQPGVYSGKIVIKADGVSPLKIPVKVKVWNFTVPVTHHLPSLFAFRDQRLLDVYKVKGKSAHEFLEYTKARLELNQVKDKTARKMIKIRHLYHEMLLKHRIIPDDFYRLIPPRVDEVREWFKRGATSFAMISPQTIWKGAKVGDVYPAKRKKLFFRRLEPAIEKFRKAGLLDKGIVYGFDEVGMEQYEYMRDIYSAIKSKYPELKTMTTAFINDYGRISGLNKAVDIWCPLLQHYDGSTDAFKTIRKQGGKVWYYVCCWPYSPYPNLLLQYSPLDARILYGFMAKKLKTDGVLYYAVNLWRSPRQVVDQKTGKKVTRWLDFDLLKNGPLTNSDGKSYGSFYGDGVLMYPGVAGPVATIRLKNIRDGFEDYEYLYLLQDYASRKSGLDPALRSQLSKYKNIPDRIVKSSTEFERNSKKISQYRDAIGELLNKISKSSSTK